ncbi:MAG: conjugal transfer protein TraB [Desulfosalsimonas sp.]
MKEDEIILKAAKEITVKFIEVGNITPSTFHAHFRNIYATVEKAVRKDGQKKEPEQEEG